MEPPTFRQIKDWPRLGIIDSVTLNREGRRYGENAVVEFIEVKDALNRVRKIDYVVLGFFGIGKNPTEAALFRAYRRFLCDLERVIDHRRGELEQTPSRARRQVRENMRLLRVRLPLIAGQVDELTRQMAAAERSEVDPATGEPYDLTAAGARDAIVEEFLDALAGENEGETHDLLRTLFDLPDEVFEDLLGEHGMPTMDELRATLDSISFDELIAKRDLVLSPEFWESTADVIRESPPASLIGQRTDAFPAGLMIAFALLGGIFRERLGTQ